MMPMEEVLEGRKDREILFDHEKRIGKMEGRIDNFAVNVDLMMRSFDDLRQTVIKTHEESLSFMQGVVKHDQGIEKVKLEFEQKMAEHKAEQERKEAEMKADQERKDAELARAQEEFEREQTAQNKEMTRTAIKKFVAWFAPIATIVAALLSEWIQNIFNSL